MTSDSDQRLYNVIEQFTKTNFSELPLKYDTNCCMKGTTNLFTLRL